VARLSLRAKGVAVLTVPLAVLVLVLLAIYRVEVAARDAEALIARAYDARTSLVRLDMHLTEAGSAVSAYLATGDPNQLSIHAGVRGSVDQDLAVVTDLTAGDPSSRQSLQEIRQSADDETHVLSAPAGIDVPRRVENRAEFESVDAFPDRGPG